MSKNPFDKISETDSFWDVGDMLPDRKVKRAFSNDTDTVEINVTKKSEPSPENCGESIPKLSEAEKRLLAAKEAMRKAEIKIGLKNAAAMNDKIDFDTEKPEKSEPVSDTPLFEYTPEGNPLIKKVSVLPWPARYSFYERFRTDAVRLFDREGKPCEPVPFFSYTPQYVQLSREQLNCYLWWRGEVRNGNYPKIDYSYILLYIYEVINLPDLVPAEKGVRLLCGILKAYRKDHPKLDRLLSEWICDYCLIGKVAPPDEEYRDFLGELISASTFKEFYAGYDGRSQSPFASALFAYSSNYNYRSSRFITDENRELFDKHIKDAFVYAFKKGEDSNSKAFTPAGKSMMVSAFVTRNAYSGALCAYNVKRIIKIEFFSCSRSVELRYTVTDAVKYSENCVRAMLGIRSRFHTPNLALPIREAIDEYFEPFRKNIRKEKSEVIPEYEKLYEAKKSDFSLEFAKKIEESSWQITGLLTDNAEFSDEPETEEEPETVEISEQPEKIASVDSEYIKQALAALLESEQQQFRAVAVSNNLLPDALTEKINDALYDVLGDIVVIEDGSSYRILEDYREDVIQWMKN